jgi:hypothetical protein
MARPDVESKADGKVGTHTNLGRCIHKHIKIRLHRHRYDILSEEHGDRNTGQAGRTPATSLRRNPKRSAGHRTPHSSVRN